MVFKKLHLFIAATFAAAILAIPNAAFAAIAGPDAYDPATSSPMHRLYNMYSGEHFYTASDDECAKVCEAGWIYEGIGWVAPEKSETPVYRLYNKYAGDHHYTINREEVATLVKAGWTDEGIGWYSDDNKAVALYRQYNPFAQTGTHNYTPSKTENDELAKLGWNEEGIGWYGVAGGTPLGADEQREEYRRILDQTKTAEYFARIWKKVYLDGTEDDFQILIKASLCLGAEFTYSNDPATIDDVVETRKGDCFSGGKLLAYMLKEMGYQAELRLASLDDMSRYPDGMDFGTEHYNVVVTIKGVKYYIDGTPGRKWYYLCDDKGTIEYAWN